MRKEGQNEGRYLNTCGKEKRAKFVKKSMVFATPKEDIVLTVLPQPNPEKIYYEIL